MQTLINYTTHGNSRFVIVKGEIATQEEAIVEILRNDTTTVSSLIHNINWEQSSEEASEAITTISNFEFEVFTPKYGNKRLYLITDTERIEISLV